MKPSKAPILCRPSRRCLVATGIAAFVSAIISPRWLSAADESQPNRVSPSPEKVNAMLAKADADIRARLLRLSEKFPQLETTNFHTLAKDLERKAEAGTVDVSVGNYSGGKGGQHTPVAKEDTYSVIVFLRRARPSDSNPNAPQPQMNVEPVYKHLGLVGRVHVSAGDEKLDAALHRLLDDAMAPLAKLDKDAGGE